MNAHSSKLIFGYSGVLALLTAVGAAWSDSALPRDIDWVSGQFLAIAWAGAMAVVAGHCCRFLDLALERIRLPGSKLTAPMLDFDISSALASFVKWTTCFVAGPAFLAYEALRFWIQCREITFLHGIVLAALSILAMIWWLTGVLVLTTRPDVVVPTPWRILKTLHQIGLRVLPGGAAIAAIGLIHLWLGGSAVIVLHSSRLAGLGLLWVFWFSVWHCGSLTMRILGRWHSQARAARPQETAIRAA